MILMIFNNDFSAPHLPSYDNKKQQMKFNSKQQHIANNKHNIKNHQQVKPVVPLLSVTRANNENNNVSSTNTNSFAAIASNKTKRTNNTSISRNNTPQQSPFKWNAIVKASTETNNLNNVTALLNNEQAFPPVELSITKKPIPIKTDLGIY